MRILIIGGTGFIGPFVVRRLVEHRHDVTIFHRGEREADLPGDVQHIHGDRSTIGEHTAELARLAPDVVLDMRPMTEADALELLAAVRGVTKRVVAVSSVDVYRAYGRLHGSEPGPPEPMPLNEDSPLREQLYPYRGERGGRFDDYDKIPVERAVMTHPESAGTVVRLPAVHGEGDEQHRLFMETRRFQALRPFLLVAREAAAWRWPRAYAGNAAEAIVLAVTDGRAAGRIYNAPTDPPLTQTDWLQACARVSSWSGEIIEVPGELLPSHLTLAGAGVQDMVVDGARMRDELGYVEPFAMDEGIARAIAWEREHPPERIKPEWVDFSLEDEALAAARR